MIKSLLVLLLLLTTTVATAQKTFSSYTNINMRTDSKKQDKTVFQLYDDKIVITRHESATIFNVISTHRQPGSVFFECLLLGDIKVKGQEAQIVLMNIDGVFVFLVTIGEGQMLYILGEEKKGPQS